MADTNELEVEEIMLKESTYETLLQSIRTMERRENNPPDYWKPALLIEAHRFDLYHTEPNEPYSDNAPKKPYSIRTGTTGADYAIRILEKNIKMYSDLNLKSVFMQEPLSEHLGLQSRGLFFIKENYKEGFIFTECWPQLKIYRRYFIKNPKNLFKKMNFNINKSPELGVDPTDPEDIKRYLDLLEKNSPEIQDPEHIEFKEFSSDALGCYLKLTPEFESILEEIERNDNIPFIDKDAIDIIKHFGLKPETCPSYDNSIRLNQNSEHTLWIN